ncbi:hypothetical protein ACFL0L_03595 [Patescibacteria group bacterium]
MFAENKSQRIWQFTRQIIKELFKVSLVSYFLLYLINDLAPGFVSRYFNLNIVLVIIVVSGIISIFGGEEEVKKEKKHIRMLDYIFILIAGLITAILIFVGIKDMGKLAYLVSIVAGGIVIIISILLFHEPTKDHD